MQVTTERSHATRTIRSAIAILAAASAAALMTLATHVTTARAALGSDAPSRAKRPPARPNYAPHVRSNIVITRGRFVGRQLTTWYGPGFFGRRTACGQTLRRSTWGVAHRTLPCGTLVTLSRGAKRVSVRVIDRGPFSGATLDLTSRTRDYLKFVDGSVNMAVVTRYRLAGS